MNIKKWAIVGTALGVFILSMASFQGCNAIKSKSCAEWVAKIDDYTICKEEIDKEYDLVLETYAKMQMVSKEKLLELVNDDNAVKQNRMLIQLRKENFVERYINEYLIYQEALRQKIHEKPKVQIMLKHQEKSVISQAYLEETLQKDITVSQEKVQEYYMNYKKRDPRVARLPIQQALQQIRHMLTERKKQMEVQKKVQEMREKFKIERNKIFSSNNDDTSETKDQKDNKNDKTDVKEPDKK